MSSSQYWIINWVTREYYPVSSDFFEGDWRKNTPWPYTDYADFSAQKIYSDQVFQEKVFYGYDLTQNGMIVGVYYDVSVALKDVQAHVEKLRREHDVVSVSYHALTLREKEINANNLARLNELQKSIGIINDSHVHSFDQWELPSDLKTALNNYQVMRDQLNRMLAVYNIESL